MSFRSFVAVGMASMLSLVARKDPSGLGECVGATFRASLSELLDVRQS
jgi:hypothetical protein